MRADMAKVIVERPRLGSRSRGKAKGYRRRLRRYGEDGPPMRGGFKAYPISGSKFLNEHLGPLRRYLNKQVGRPWSKVFSEICAHVDRSNAVQDHVRDHVDQYVARHVILIDGVPCDGSGGRTYGLPLDRLGWTYWYVCPRTGLLRRVKRPRPKPECKKEGLPKFIPVSDALQCRFIDGAWHLVTFKPIAFQSLDDLYTRFDVLLNLPFMRLTAQKAQQHYGAPVYAASIRRLSRKELRNYPIPVKWW